MKQFTFRDGNRISGVDADVAGLELERIHEKHGALKPKAVVDESRPDDAPLHPVFEWNDEIAAEEWRVHTARNLIRSVHVIKENSEPAPVYVNVQNANKDREYQPIDVVVQKVDLYAAAIYEAQCRINAAKKSLDDLENAAVQTNTDDVRIAAIRIAMQALSTASDAVNKLH